MHVAVLLAGEITEFPPAINIINILLSLNHAVTLVANGAKCITPNYAAGDNFKTVDLGPKNTKAEKVKQLVQTRKNLKEYVRLHDDSVDVFWVMTDLTAREIGRELLGKKYVLNISELVEYVPFITARPMPLHSKSAIKLAQNAARVVVPEYNRAHIQKVWWDLPEVPCVLPNRPASYGQIEFRDADLEIQRAFKNEERRILLYQGVFSQDRSFAAFPEALKELGGNYCLYLMGKAIGDQAKVEVQHLVDSSEQIEVLDFVPAPYHLAYTAFGHIGLLPYKPTKGGRCSCLNALYCAPNKIWEYARVGLPMIGSDVPGLKSQLTASGSGLVANMDDPDSIVEAVRAIDDNYDEFSVSSKAFYESCDPAAIVAGILDGLGA